MGTIMATMRGKWTESDGRRHVESFCYLEDGRVLAIVDGWIVGAYPTITQAVQAARRAVAVVREREQKATE